MATKQIPQRKLRASFRFSRTTTVLLRKLAKLPEYQSSTNVIEMLVLDKARELGLYTGNGNVKKE